MTKIRFSLVFFFHFEMTKTHISYISISNGEGWKIGKFYLNLGIYSNSTKFVAPHQLDVNL